MTKSPSSVAGIDPGAKGGIAILRDGLWSWCPWPAAMTSPVIAAAIRSVDLLVIEEQQWRGGADHTKAVSISALIEDAGRAHGWAVALLGEGQVMGMTARMWRRWSSTPSSPGAGAAAYRARKAAAAVRAAEIVGRPVPLRYADAVCIAEAARIYHMTKNQGKT
jgi:hypothetical protein